MTFADKLKQLRKEKGITQVELADAIGVERSSVGKYEGRKPVIPSDDVKIRIAQYFGVSLDYLFDIKELALDAIINNKPIQYPVTFKDQTMLDKVSQLTPENRIRFDAFLDGLLAGQEKPKA